MKKIIHRANERGIAEHGWLHSRFSFSFADYYNPDKMGFGLLRVINDDEVEPGSGFGTHPHNNMEIITIVQEGTLTHKDSMGSVSQITPGEIQVMSAGSGITHSEYNHSAVEAVKLLQIWIFPRERNLKPRYDQRRFDLSGISSGIKTVVSGVKDESTLYINQDAAISLGRLEKDKYCNYKNYFKGNGAYLFVLDGSINIDKEELKTRDAAGIYDTDEFAFNASSDTNFIVFEVPMN